MGHRGCQGAGVLDGNSDSTGGGRRGLNGTLWPSGFWGRGLSGTLWPSWCWGSGTEWDIVAVRVLGVED